jgi:hypothetical protein
MNTTGRESNSTDQRATNHATLFNDEDRERKLNRRGFAGLNRSSIAAGADSIRVLRHFSYP